VVSEARAKATAQAAEDAAELDKIADELYALRPDEFAAARDERVRQARAEGRAALARELNKLRKPTQSAWLINLLWRDQHDVMQQLFELAEALSQAQAQASGPELLRLTGQRRELEGALMRRARVLAEQAGVAVSAAMEREAQETLAAAVALPEVADEVRSGRLVKPAAYVGFGAGFGTLVQPAHRDGGARQVADTPQPAAPVPDELAGRRAAKASQPSPSSAKPEPAPAELPADPAQRAAQRARQDAERRVDEARAVLEVAADALVERGQTAEAATKQTQELQVQQQEVRQKVGELQQQLDTLRQQQRDLQAQVVAAEQAALAAGRRRDQAQKAHDAAQRALEQAEHDLAEAT
jgi:hypothetical protein